MHPCQFPDLTVVVKEESVVCGKHTKIAKGDAVSCPQLTLRWFRKCFVPYLQVKKHLNGK